MPQRSFGRSASSSSACSGRSGSSSPPVQQPALTSRCGTSPVRSPSSGVSPWSGRWSSSGCPVVRSTTGSSTRRRTPRASTQPLCRPATTRSGSERPREPVWQVGGSRTTALSPATLLPQTLVTVVDTYVEDVNVVIDRSHRGPPRHGHELVRYAGLVGANVRVVGENWMTEYATVSTDTDGNWSVPWCWATFSGPRPTPVHVWVFAPDMSPYMTGYWSTHGWVSTIGRRIADHRRQHVRER